jgi:hypothetical protein
MTIKLLYHQGSIPRLKGAPEQAYYLYGRSPRVSMLLRILDLEGAFAAPTAFPNCVPLADCGLYGWNVCRLIRATHRFYYSVEES